jgi:hypothetical protein
MLEAIITVARQRFGEHSSPAKEELLQRRFLCGLCLIKEVDQFFPDLLVYL